MSIMRHDDGSQTFIGGLLSIIWLIILVLGILLYWAISNIGNIPPTFWLFLGLCAIVGWLAGKSKKKTDLREKRLAEARALRAKKEGK